MAVSVLYHFLFLFSIICQTTNFHLFLVGLPPPSVDVIGILKKPSLYHKPLYGQVARKSKQYNELEGVLLFRRLSYRRPFFLSQQQRNFGQQFAEDKHNGLRNKWSAYSAIAWCCTARPMPIEKRASITISNDGSVRQSPASAMWFGTIANLFTKTTHSNTGTLSTSKHTAFVIVDNLLINFPPKCSQNQLPHSDTVEFFQRLSTETL